MAKKKVEKVVKKEKVKVVKTETCPDCKWKAGLDDENTLCATCSGSGIIEI